MTSQESTRRSSSRRRWLRPLLLGAALAGLFALARLLPVERWVDLASERIEGLGPWGPAAFALAYVLAALLFVPGAAITIAAGALFGLGRGTLIVSIASTAAAALAFLVGRHLARDAVQSWAARRPRFAAIDRAIGQGGWKIVALLRLSPVVPFSLGNYLFGLTPIGFLPYVLASWVAMLPGTFLYVYLGHAGRAGLAATAGEAGEKSPAEWALLGAGLLATIVVLVVVTRTARRAIAEQTGAPAPAGSAPRPHRKGPSRARSGWAATRLLASAAVVLASGACPARTPVASARETVSAAPAARAGDVPAFDHSVFDALLKRHVDARGLVDYAALAEDEALDAYLRSLAGAPLDALAGEERLALLINAYNAFTLGLILDHAPVKSIKDIPASKRWNARRWSLGGRLFSLDEIEHEQVRKGFREPRIHFALVCAAMGCPPLRREAYVADRLDEQLQSQAAYVHGHDTWFQLDPRVNVLRLTRLYDWYESDFEEAAGSVLEYAARHSPELKEALDSGARPKLKFLDYDWSLNGRERKP